MSGQLPAQIDPIRLADEGARLYGALPGSKMSRLQELALPNSRPEPVAVSLHFERTGQGVRRMHGTIRTQVEMACKRCLKPLKIEIVAQPLFVLLQSGEAEPEECETLVVTAPLSLAELVEDELLLAMPMSPGHAEGECEVAFPGSAGQAPVAEKRTNPFAELRGFKGKNQ
ncbi:MAG TPA: YceD family protein [Acidiferrobacterales bacterium]|nr:YceD family protein [Acidiferrobacterales bacterium]